jgi:predicted acyl esterase
VKAGHRLRLLVAAGAFPRFARNLGTGEPLGSGTDMRAVEITVHCGGSSRLSFRAEAPAVT